MKSWLTDELFLLSFDYPICLSVKRLSQLVPPSKKRKEGEIVGLTFYDLNE